MDPWQLIRTSHGLRQALQGLGTVNELGENLALIMKDGKIYRNTVE